MDHNDALKACEMDHHDALQAFRPSAALEAIISRMSLTDIINTEESVSKSRKRRKTLG
ncbi:hypothetical protein CHS0354_040071 [Potamilus streckersoni]|uniref:Uncharacterized protein n=1 Tax=Potamilus streckersoni TaxID=2493646 RepID=A0AAE0ST69_9BIVA|nr:hypothetical protein CHS0354_040071 [Potamilus streckersoni]